MIVTQKRHIAKTITWRLIGTLDTIILGWLITGNFKFGIAIGGVEVVTKMILYYLHERVWYKYVKFGLKSDIKKKTKKDKTKEIPEEVVTEVEKKPTQKRVLNYTKKS